MTPIRSKANRPHPTTNGRVLDEFARSLSERMPRRSACRLLGGGALGAALAGLGLADAAAGCRRVGEPCRRDKGCCSGRCVGKRCRRRRKSPDIVPLPPVYELPDDAVLNLRRRVRMNASMRIVDDEDFVSDEVCDYHDLGEEAVLTPDAPSGRIQLARGCGGEVRVELVLEFALLDNGDVRGSGRVSLYEGTSESTSDLDGEEPIADFVVRRDDSAAFQVIVRNEREGGDGARIDFTFTNAEA